MATYKLIGQRWLRKYTASRKNPVGMAADDAQKIADTLCEVPWERASAKDAVTTYHTESVVYKNEKTGEEVGGLEMNVRIRDELDAALFCAGHDGSTHRAYANAAVYAYAVPPAAQGKSLSSLAVRVTSDNYNSQGCRLHVWTSDDATIPMSCHDVRGEDSSGAVVEDGTTARGAAPRTTKTVKSTDSKGKEVSTDYWYPTTETVTLSPTGGLALKKYLFLAVVLESYSTVRGNWLEGCSYIANSVEATLSEAVDGWADGETYDLRAGGVEGEVANAAGVNPTWLQPLATKAAETCDCGVLILNRFSDEVVTSGTSTTVSSTVLLYVLGYDKDLVPTLLRVAQIDMQGATKELLDFTSDQLSNYANKGVLPDNEAVCARGIGTPVLDGYDLALGKNLGVDGSEYYGFSQGQLRHRLKILLQSTTSSVEQTTSQFTEDYTITEANGILSYACLSPTIESVGGSVSALRFNVKFSVSADKKVPTADASSRVRDGTAADELLGDLSWQVTTGDRSMAVRTAADTFRHLVGLLGEASGRVAHDYAAAGGTFPVSDLDCVTVVPRFERQATATASYASLPQPGISLWYRKTAGAFAKKGYVGIKDYGSKVQCVDSPSFIQGSFLVVRAPKSGSRLVLTAGAAVANTGLSLKIAAWRSSGVAWDRASGFHTAAQFPKVAGFAGASVESLDVPEVKIGESGEYAGAAVCGGIKAELLGTTATIDGALAEGDSFEIELAEDVEEGDAIILSPVPVAFTGTATDGAYFGRQSEPTATTAAKGWARSTADLGWFPKVEVY